MQVCHQTPKWIGSDHIVPATSAMLAAAAQARPQVQYNAYSSSKLAEQGFSRRYSGTHSYVPPGGLTLIVGTQKWGVFLQGTEATPCGHPLK